MVFIGSHCLCTLWSVQIQKVLDWVCGVAGPTCEVFMNTSLSVPLPKPQLLGFCLSGFDLVLEHQGTEMTWGRLLSSSNKQVWLEETGPRGCKWHFYQMWKQTLECLRKEGHGTFIREPLKRWQISGAVRWHPWTSARQLKRVTVGL